MRSVDVIIVGASLSAAAAAKRLVDAGLETIVLERKELPRHKICSGIRVPWRPPRGARGGIGGSLKAMQKAGIHALG